MFKYEDIGNCPILGYFNPKDNHSIWNCQIAHKVVCFHYFGHLCSPHIDNNCQMIQKPHETNHFLFSKFSSYIMPFDIETKTQYIMPFL